MEAFDDRFKRIAALPTADGSIIKSDARQADPAPDNHKKIASALSADRHNDGIAIAKRWKVKIAMLVPVVIGTAITLLMIPKEAPTTTRFYGMSNVLASSFEDDFPNSLLQESALDWLANKDPANLALDTDSTTLLERYTAALFYFATKGDGWTDQTQWLTSNAVCFWKGLECTNQGFLGRMIIDTNNLVGQIPSELALLTNLDYFFLQENALTGPIPSELGLLTKLSDLGLNYNALTGPIPSEFGLLTELTDLALHDNALTGPIPSDLGLLPTLIRLFLWNNDLTGPMPSEVGLLTTLHNLRFENNSLTGPIPSELGLLTELTTLFSFNNALTGYIPSQLHQVKTAWIHLVGNSFTNCEDFKANHTSDVECVGFL